MVLDLNESLKTSKQLDTELETILDELKINANSLNINSNIRNRFVTLTESMTEWSAYENRAIQMEAEMDKRVASYNKVNEEKQYILRAYRQCVEMLQKIKSSSIDRDVDFTQINGLNESMKKLTEAGNYLTSEVQQEITENINNDIFDKVLLVETKLQKGEISEEKAVKHLYKLKNITDNANVISASVKDLINKDIEEYNVDINEPVEAYDIKQSATLNSSSQEVLDNANVEKAQIIQALKNVIEKYQPGKINDSLEEILPLMEYVNDYFKDYTIKPNVDLEESAQLIINLRQKVEDLYLKADYREVCKQATSQIAGALEDSAHNRYKQAAQITVKESLKRCENIQNNQLPIVKETLEVDESNVSEETKTQHVKVMKERIDNLQEILRGTKTVSKEKLGITYKEIQEMDEVLASDKEMLKMMYENALLKQVETA